MPNKILIASTSLGGGPFTAWKAPSKRRAFSFALQDSRGGVGRGWGGGGSGCGVLLGYGGRPEDQAGYPWPTGSSRGRTHLIRMTRAGRHAGATISPGWCERVLRGWSKAASRARAKFQLQN